MIHPYLKSAITAGIVILLLVVGYMVFSDTLEESGLLMRAATLFCALWAVVMAWFQGSVVGYEDGHSDGIDDTLDTLEGDGLIMAPSELRKLRELLEEKDAGSLAWPKVEAETDWEIPEDIVNGLTLASTPAGGRP